MITHKAILLIGPTGSGKTPLGELLDGRELWGRRCTHFDFGEALRRAATVAAGPSGLDAAELAVVTDVLGTGALLRDDQFPIAAKILSAFIRERGLGERDTLVLNGLPRHVGQARGLADVVDLRLVVQLECPSGVVVERVRADVGGDREGRADDDVELIRRKLEIYRRQTLPLVEHLKRSGVAMETVGVSVDTGAEDIVRRLSELALGILFT